MQVGPVDVNERPPVKFLANVDQRGPKRFPSRAPVASDQSVRQETRLQHLVQQPQRLHHLDRVGCHLDAGTDLAETLGPLEQAHFEAAPQQAGGQRYAADTASYDANSLFRSHRSTPFWPQDIN